MSVEFSSAFWLKGESGKMFFNFSLRCREQGQNPLPPLWVPACGMFYEKIDIIFITEWP